jgi:hypothetical protein
MERILSLTTFEEQGRGNPWLEYWLSRPPEERIAEVERLRRDYFALVCGSHDKDPERLQRSLLLVDRAER